MARLLKFAQHFGTCFPRTRITLKFARIFALMEIQQALLTSFLKLLQHLCARFAAACFRYLDRINITFHQQTLAACLLQFSPHLFAG